MAQASEEYRLEVGKFPVKIGDLLRHSHAGDNYTIETYWTVTRILGDGYVAAIRDLPPRPVACWAGTPVRIVVPRAK